MSELPKPGLHRVNWETYSAWDARRYSELRHFKRSPLHAHYLALNPEEPSQQMDLGSAIHVAVLEPDAFDARYVCGIRVDRRTTVGKAEWAAFQAEHAGKGILSADEHETCERVRESVWRQPWAQELLAGPGANEVSALWVDEQIKIPCKSRIDRLASRVIDLKSTRDASAESFGRSVANFDYHLQAAFYLDGLDTLQPAVREWVWIAVETAPPYAPALYVPTTEMIEEGRKRYRAALVQWRECMREGWWPGYASTPQLLDLPAWAKPKAPKEEGSDDRVF